MDLQDKGGKELGDLSLRDRVTPRLNLEATSLQTLISWKLEELHEPVYTCKLTKGGAHPVPGETLPCPKVQHPHTGISTGTVYSYMCIVQVPVLVHVQRQEQRKVY